MKKLILLGVIIIFSGSVYAQTTFKAKEEAVVMSKGLETALTVEIPEASKKETEKEWKRFMKDADAKVKSKSGEITAVEAELRGFSQSQTVYAIVKPSSEGVKLQVFFEHAAGFLTSDAEEPFRAAKSIVEDFARDVYTKTITEQLEKEEKHLSSLIKGHEDMIEEHSMLLEAIEEYKAAIIKAEKDIEENIKNREQAVKDIDEKQSSVESVRKKLNNIK